MGMFWDSATEKAARRGAAAAAAGTGPSAARSQLAQGLAQTQNGMMAQAAGVRQNPLAAMRMAQQQGAQMAGQANMQAAQLRGQEQLQGQQQQMQIAQQDAATQQALVGGLMNMGGAALSGGLSGMAPKPAVEGGGSDIRMKDNIQPAGDRTDALLASIRPEQYNYRDPAREGGGNRLGVMAQDLQRADPNLVDQRPDGNLAINGPAALSASLAANARLAQRLDAIEGRLAPPTPGNKGKFDSGGPGDNRDAFENARGAERTRPVPPPPTDNTPLLQSRAGFGQGTQPQPLGAPLPPEILAARRDAEAHPLYDIEMGPAQIEAQPHAPPRGLPMPRSPTAEELRMFLRAGR